MVKIILNNLKETEKFGYKIGQILKSGDLISMIGDLGAGKTTLTKSIAKGLGVEDYVTSPTFTLINEYQGRIPLYHFDVYRLGDVDELLDLGYEEYFYSNGVTIVEWANKIQEILPQKRINIQINKMQNQNSREIIISGKGNRYKEITEELKKN